MILLRLVTAKKGQAALDPDAQAFITAAGITDATQKSAINQLVLNLKSYSLWTKMKAVYPFVGGTSTTNKFNLINPADTNAAYRLLFAGTWVYASTGVTPNPATAGVSGSFSFANTYMTPSVLAQNDNSLGCYVRTQSIINTGYVEMGTDIISGVGFDIGACWSLGANLGAFCRNNDSGYGNSVLGTSQGFFINSRKTSTSVKLYHNGSLINTNSSTSQTPTSTVNIAIGGQMLSNNIQVNWQTGRELAFAFMSDGLNDTEASNLYTAVQAYQTTLGRQV